ncbi:MAG: ATP-binding protein [Gemmatimonadetes bacterium]|nr:ATP-binding protein [Gemmatimonadota bacterium]
MIVTGGGLVTNLELARFARHYGARVKVRRPYRAHQGQGRAADPLPARELPHGRTFDILRRCDAGELAGGEAITRLLGAHIDLRNARRLQTAMRAARLPVIKTLADFDFTFQPSVKREQLESLHTLGFLERKENVVFLGPPGVGKTHRAVTRRAPPSTADGSTSPRWPICCMPWKMRRAQGAYRSACGRSSFPA